MARNMSLETYPVYRAVLLTKFSGIHTVAPKTYTKSDGTVIDYHRSDVQGPYTSKSSAKAAITRESGYLRNYSQADEIVSFVEEATVVWNALG